MSKLITIKTSFILCILIFSILTIIPINDTAKADEDNSASRIIAFNSYIDIDYDLTPLNDPLQIDVSIAIPITISYWTDIPNIFDVIPYPLNFYYLYGGPIGPMQKIHLEVLNTPDWANIYLSSQDILTDIPFASKGRETVTTNLIISPRIEAPAQSYTISIKASCEGLKRLNGFTYQESIDFTPSFIPTIQIMVENPIRQVAPNTEMNIEIVIKNLGNKITKVTPSLDKISEEIENKWTTVINPAVLEIQPNSQNSFTFSIISPFEPGWHNYNDRFEISFKSEVYPFRVDSPTTTESVYIIAKNYGFTIPGFELIIFIMALIIIGIIIQKRRFK